MTESELVETVARACAAADTIAGDKDPEARWPFYTVLATCIVQGMQKRGLFEKENLHVGRG